LTDQLALDHLVYAVPDLESAIALFDAQLGIAPTRGGRHEGLGTHNAILCLEDETYIELIAAEPDVAAPRIARPFGLDSLTSPRLATWAVRSRDIESHVSQSRTRGYDPGTVLDMTRAEPSGETLRWKLSLGSDSATSGLVPFVIDWGDTRHPARKSTPSTLRCRLSSFSAHHPEPDRIRQALDALGVELRVEQEAGPGLVACVTGPAGSLVLK
jgi:hypothetical protein